MTWIILITLSIISGILYRLGGWGDEGRKKFPNLPEWLFNTKARDVGCALVTGLGLCILLGFTTFPIWAHLVAFGLLFVSLTTYWDFLFGFDNHWFHGFACGVAYFPYAIVSGDWLGFGFRCIALAVLMGVISTSTGNDVAEEVGRGATLPITLPILA